MKLTQTVVTAIVMLMVYKQLTTLLHHSVEVGCLRHPGASTIGSYLQMDRVHPWLPKTDNPAMSPHAAEQIGTHHTETVESRGEGKHH